MDILAGTAVNTVQTKQEVCSHTVMGFYDKHNSLITNIGNYLVELINGKKLQEYICKRYGWEKHLYKELNWTAVGNALKTYTPYKRNKIIQLIYDWQNDGDQMTKFKGVQSECPTYRKEEAYLHYLPCTNKKMEEMKSKGITTLSKGMKCANMYPGIVAMVVAILKQVFESIEENTSVSSYTEWLAHDALVHQREYDFHTVAKGY